MNSIILLLILDTILNSNSFNISPKPNFVIKEPTISLKKYRPSYFGYTLLLKYKSLFVGAPRSQSTIESQRHINETGILYKCSLDEETLGQCFAYIVDQNGNEHPEENEHTIDSKIKDHQWLGGSLDGGSEDSDPLIVCAPRMKAETSEDYLMHGICYRIPDTVDDQPSQIKIISPLKGTNNQIWGKTFAYAFGESGLSVHWTGKTDEILIGAPGINDWKGTVIRYRSEEDLGLGGLQKREVNALKEKYHKFTSTIPNPDLWNQPDFSYFGFSVTAGVFNINSAKKQLYVASAPRANNYDGEVYIYDIVRDNSKKSNNQNLQKYKTFSGKQFGEFFGYSVITADINGDENDEIIVSAPLYAKNNIYDCGAIYVYLNVDKNLVFQEQLIQCPNNDHGRFGSTIALLGDINHDGFNDLAISAPFSGNGKVYIYSGRKNGLQKEPTQIIEAPKNEHLTIPHMFGYGLSKGLDIDGNGYNDIAIGSPNAEIVYLYKTYPVVKITSTIGSNIREIQQDQKILDIEVCFRMIENIENNKKIFNQDLKLKLEADTRFKRVRFTDISNSVNDIINLELEKNICKFYKANVDFILQHIFQPIEFKMIFNLFHKVPNTEEYCNKCAALDPSFENNLTYKLAFTTGCLGEVCIPDLNLRSFGLNRKFIIGSSKTITVEYIINNKGETAYLPQINVTSSNRMPFAKVPSMCNTQDSILICDLNSGQRLLTNESDTIKIEFDASHILVNLLEITAKVFSSGNEINSLDNIVVDKIIMIELSSLDVIQINRNEIISLDEKQGQYEIVNKFEIKNVGPSHISEATIAISIPFLYHNPKTTTFITVISSNNISFSANFNSYELRPIFHRNENNIKLNVNQSDHFNFDYGLEFQNVDENLLSQNLRHSTSDFDTFYKESLNNQKSSKLSSDFVIHDQTGTLPDRKVIKFNCSTQQSKCIKIIIKADNFDVSNQKGVNIELKYLVDLDEISKLLTEEKEFFFIANEFNIYRAGNQANDTIDIPRKDFYVIVSKHRLSSTPIWVIILAVIAGFTLLSLIVFGFYKMGFFERKKIESMNSEDQAEEPMINTTVNKE